MKRAMSNCRGFLTSGLFLTLIVFLGATRILAEETSPLYVQAQRGADRDGYELITTTGLKQLLDARPDVLLVDVRFAYEFAQGHIPGAVSLPVDLRDRGDLSRERRQAFLDALGPDKERPIVLYCRDFR